MVRVCWSTLCRTEASPNGIAALLARRIPQSIIDPLLPSRPTLLEVVEDVAIDAQRDELFGVRDQRARRRRFCGLGRSLLERGFSCVPYTQCPATAVLRHS